MEQVGERMPKLRWSVVIPAHNCAHFLTDALTEVVEQLADRDDAEIIVVDDASSDDPEAVVRAVGKGRVRYERNPKNLGAINTFNRCIALSRGEIVHILHGDDLVLNGFYDTVEGALEGTSALMAMCRTIDIDGGGATLYESRHYRNGTGVWEGAFAAFSVSNRVRTPGIVVRRSAYENFGPFRPDLPHAADWELWTRMASRGPVVFVDEVLAGYRKHAESDTAHRMVTGVNIRERITAIGMISEHVAPQRRRATVRKALLYSAAYAGRCAIAAAKRQQWRVASVQAREAARCLMLAPRASPGGRRARRDVRHTSVIRSAPEHARDL